MADESLQIHIDGKVYDLDDFELGELEWLEDELGALDDVTLSSIKAALRFVYVIKKRDNPDFTLDDARKLKLKVFEEPNGNGERRPTRAAKAAKSTRAASGASS